MDASSIATIDASSGRLRPLQLSLSRVAWTRAVAAQLGHKAAFQVDASRIARLPLTADYFPELAGNAIPVRGRDPELVTKVEERLRELVAIGVEIIRADAVARAPK